MGEAKAVRNQHHRHRRSHLYHARTARTLLDSCNALPVPASRPRFDPRLTPVDAHSHPLRAQATRTRTPDFRVRYGSALIAREMRSAASSATRRAQTCVSLARSAMRRYSRRRTEKRQRFRAHAPRALSSHRAVTPALRHTSRAHAEGTLLSATPLHPLHAFPARKKTCIGNLEFVGNNAGAFHACQTAPCRNAAG